MIKTCKIIKTLCHPPGRYAPLVVVAGDHSPLPRTVLGTPAAWRTPPWQYHHNIPGVQAGVPAPGDGELLLLLLGGLHQGQGAALQQPNHGGITGAPLLPGVRQYHTAEELFIDLDICTLHDVTVLYCFSHLLQGRGSIGGSSVVLLKTTLAHYVSSSLIDPLLCRLSPTVSCVSAPVSRQTSAFGP